VSSFLFFYCFLLLFIVFKRAIAAIIRALTTTLQAVIKADALFGVAMSDCLFVSFRLEGICMPAYTNSDN
jgi:hypothetical protein